MERECAMQQDERIKQAREEGYQAYMQGENRDDNPYNNSDEYVLYQAWQEGFMDAGWDD